MIPMNMTHTHTQKAEMQSKGTHDTSEEGSDAWEKWEQWEAAVAEGMKARKNSREKRMQEERQAGVEERAKQVVAWTEELDRCAKIETKLLDSDNMASVSTPCFDVYCARPQFFWKIDTECAPYQIESVSKIQHQQKIARLQIDIMDTNAYDFILQACWLRQLDYEQVCLSPVSPLAICVNEAFVMSVQFTYSIISDKYHTQQSKNCEAMITYYETSAVAITIARATVLLARDIDVVSLTCTDTYTCFYTLAIAVQAQRRCGQHVRVVVQTAQSRASGAAGKVHLKYTSFCTWLLTNAVCRTDDRVLI